MFPLSPRFLLVCLLATYALPGQAVAEPNSYEPRRYITEKRIKEVHDAFAILLRPEPSPISLQDARHIVTFGTLSGLAARCGLPWQDQIFLPMMSYYRHTRKFSESQMKFVGLMHGFQQGTVQKEVPENSCSAHVRDSIARSMKVQKRL
ncbi:hypothetical protein SAMN02927923_03550 [Microvirga guangxiensis]|uniref:Uncharacterized protein n=1 Tax=Microvirga guangxiensis TaxID=549386 RepID=A0A1G5KRD3_9HYPH|nr:hypothetical protein SAMN02927923_03550 [Microvirga guangxiensis]